MTPDVPYRRMPVSYIATCVVFFGFVALYQSGVPQSTGAWAELVSTALIGGGLIGWGLWRVWLYKKFPAA